MLSESQAITHGQNEEKKKEKTILDLRQICIIAKTFCKCTSGKECHNIAEVRHQLPVRTLEALLENRSRLREQTHYYKGHKIHRWNKSLLLQGILSPNCNSHFSSNLVLNLQVHWTKGIGYEKVSYRNFNINRTVSHTRPKLCYPYDITYLYTNSYI